MNWDGLPDKIIMGAGSAIFTWLAWLTVRCLGLPNRDEVVQMIQVHSPYTKDAEDIRHRLEQLQKSHAKLDEYMDQQSDDLHAVRGDVQEIKAILRERPRRPE